MLTRDLPAKLIDFIDNTADEANSAARARAIEIVSTNTVWIDRKEDEIIEAFGGIRRQASELSPKSRVDNAKLAARMKQAYEQKFTWPFGRKNPVHA